LPEIHERILLSEENWPNLAIVFFSALRELALQLMQHAKLGIIIIISLASVTATAAIL
jgi:hypothetical protein